MAFKPERPVVYSDYSHLPISSIAFCLGLRESDIDLNDPNSIKNAIEEKRKGRDKAMLELGLSKEEMAVIKGARCSIMKCVTLADQIGDQFTERKELQDKIKQCEVTLQEELDDMKPIADELKEFQDTTIMLETRYEGLRYYEQKTLLSRKYDSERTKNSLLNQVFFYRCDFLLYFLHLSSTHLHVTDKNSTK